MGSKNIWNISTQQIQIFLKAVEYKNFTEVATYFNFTPSMVSKTISAMEAELDLTLFVRKPHNLTATPVAEFLAREWKQTIASITNSIERAHALEMGESKKIVLGFVDSSDRVDNLISNSIRQYTNSHSNIDIYIEKHDMHRASELLNNGLLDVIVTSEMDVPYLNQHPHISWEKLVDTEVVVYVPSSNPLFQRESLTFDDLHSQNFIALNPTMHPNYHDWLLKTCKAHGFQPNIVTTYRTVRSLMFSLTLYDYVFIGDSITSDWCDKDLKMFKLNESSFSLIAWRKEYEDDALLDFKDYIKGTYPERF